MSHPPLTTPFSSDRVLFTKSSPHFLLFPVSCFLFLHFCCCDTHSFHFIILFLPLLFFWPSFFFLVGRLVFRALFFFSFLLLHSLDFRCSLFLFSFLFSLGICRWFDQDHSAIVFPLILSFNSPPPSTPVTHHHLHTIHGKRTINHPSHSPFRHQGPQEARFKGSPAELHST